MLLCFFESNKWKGIKALGDERNSISRNYLVGIKALFGCWVLGELNTLIYIQIFENRLPPSLVYLTTFTVEARSASILAASLKLTSKLRK